MKKLLLSVFAFASAIIANAQCTDLIISEYVEGTSNNKALEIFNPTPNAISLNNNYRLVRYNNGTGAAAGEANAQAMVNLGNPTIQSGQTYVIVIDKRDANQPCPGNECAVDSALQAKADVFLCPDYNISYAMYFNGNDAVSLQKTSNGGTSWQYVDIFGMIGDPAMVSGTAWSDAFPYDGSAGAWWTVNQTLVRKPTVMSGVTSNPTPYFIVTTEWDSLPVNTYSGLGSHTCNCPTASVNDIDNQVSVKVFPNPTNSGTFNVTATEVIETVEVYNVMGQKVISEKGNNNDKKLRLETLKLTSGVYFVKVSFENNKSTVVKLSVQ
ncbi:MAG: T9SS type A sorting domain-containing protein [Bacteroidetes bacterium]|nr:T9SS type A sorting domain-containing protein [Bacteroidota bacterium]